MGFVLADNDEALINLLESSSQPMFILAEDLKLLAANQTGQHLLGRDIADARLNDIYCGRSFICTTCPLADKAAHNRMFNPVSNDLPCSYSNPLFVSVTYQNQPAFLMVTKTEDDTDDSFYIGPINTVTGLANFGGSYDAYADIFNVYFSVGKEKYNLINKLYTEKDYYNLRIEVHGLKGTSYVIGANALGDLAKTLEFACKNIEAGTGLEDAVKLIDSSLNVMLEDYVKVLNCINPLLTHREEEALVKESKSQAEITDLLTRAIELLDDYELDDALELVRQLERTELSDANTQLVEAAIKEFLNYDYDKAGEYLRQVIL